MRVVEAENYEELAAEFQYRWVVLLRDTLKKHGVSDSVAQAVCGDFTFDLSMLFDQGEIEHEGTSYRPVVAFTDDEDDPVVLAQGDNFEFHEYAYGNTSEAYNPD